MSTSRFDRIRRPLIILCLAAALVVVCAIGWEAITAARAQRQAVEGVLRDYAELAAEQYARNVTVTLDYDWFFPALRLLTAPRGLDGLPDGNAEIQGQRKAFRLADAAVAFFVIDRESGAMRFHPIDVGVLSAGATSGEGPTDPAVEPQSDLTGQPPADLTGAQPTDPNREQLRDLVLDHAAQHYQENWPSAAFLYDTGSGSRLVVYRISVDDTAPPTADDDTASSENETGATKGNAADAPEDAAAGSLEGFVADASALRGFLAQAVTLYDLLPATLTGDADARDVVHVRVLGEEGGVLFETAPAAGNSFESVFDLPPRFAGLSVIASIPVARAGRLVVGGLPYSPLPVVAGLLAITLALLGVGVMLWRREQELVRLREQFVAGASHELRTPLAQIRMFAETLRLQRVRSDEEERRALQIIDREARRLSLLVENLLQFSAAGRGPRRFLPETANVRQLVHEVADAFEPLAAARGTRIEVTGEAGAEASVDRDMLRQVLVNLLDNAVKYGPDHQTVTVEVIEDHAAVSIAVTDQGPGVPATERPLVWQRFWRGPRADGVTGTGIGLSLVQELVALHGGTVAVEEVGGGGARFVVRLPGDRT